MNIPASITNLFSGVNPNPPAPANPVTNPVVPQGTVIPPNAGNTAPQTPGTAPNGTIPLDNSTPNNKPEAPLDQYTKLWETAPVDPNAPKQDNSIFGEVDGNALLEAAGKIDFTKVITPDMAAAISQGGEAGTAALIAAMNKVNQLTHAQGAHATTKIVEMAIAKAQDKFQASIPGILRNQNTNDLIKSDPVLSHPAAAPMVAGLVTQLQSKFPNATPQELKEQAESYLVHFSKSMLATQGDPTATTKNQLEDTDWENYFRN